jgi:hypothetical protein
VSAVLAVIAAFPTVLYTVPMGVVVLYWLMVILGALHVNILGAGEGLDVGGGADAGVDGASHSLGAGGPHGLEVDGGVSGPDGVDGDLDLPDGDSGGAADAFAALKLRSVPMTVAISLLVTFAWLTSLALEIALQKLAPALVGTGSRAAIFLVSPAVSLLCSSLAIRPLAPLFVVHNATGNSDLIGKVVTIRTGSVDKGFGEATLQEGGGSDFVLRVRVDDENALGRGDQALIVAWDEEREAFTVAPMDDVLKPRLPESR